MMWGMAAVATGPDSISPVNPPPGFGEGLGSTAPALYTASGEPVVVPGGCR